MQRARAAAAAVVALALVGPAPAVAEQGPALNYVQFCVGCHRNDASGSARNGVPDMRGQLGHFLRLPEGRAFLGQVAGVAQAPLEDAPVAALLNWMVVQFSAEQVPHTFEPYTATEVRRLRAERPADLPGMRSRIVQQLRTLGYAVDDLPDAATAHLAASNTTTE